MSRIFFLFAVIFIFVSACVNEIVTETPTVFDETNNDVVFARFSSIQEKVFNTNCATSGCHNNSVIPNLGGNSYNNIISRMSSIGTPYITPGNPANSYLYRKITGVNIFGSRMPDGLPPLPQAVIDSIETWIINGALQN